MDYTKPTLVIISGPNGAGKSTHAQLLLPKELADYIPFDRDKMRTFFESQLKIQKFDPGLIHSRASARMEEELRRQMETAIQERSHFVLETPLSHGDYWKYPDLFENSKYQIELKYIGLDNIGACKLRVANRALEGGHSVPLKTIKGVFEKNLEHINNYHKIFRLIELYDGTERPALLARIEEGVVQTADKKATKKKWIRTGLPALFEMINQYLKENT